MIKTYNGITPGVPASAFVSETALVMGNVRLGEYVGIWPGAVIRGDFAKPHCPRHPGAREARTRDLHITNSPKN